MDQVGPSELHMVLRVPVPAVGAWKRGKAPDSYFFLLELDERASLMGSLYPHGAGECGGLQGFPGHELVPTGRCSMAKCTSPFCCGAPFLASGISAVKSILCSISAE